MDFEQMLDMYVRLRRDLALEYCEGRWNSQRIDFLADELARTERALARLRPGGDWTLGLGPVGRTAD